MKSGEKKKTQEVLEIPVSDAITNPWAMMIMDLNTDSTLTAVEGSWGSEHVASIAITKLIVSQFLWPLQNEVGISMLFSLRIHFL